MRSKQTNLKSDKLVKDIRRANRKLYSAEEKIRIVLEGLRGEKPEKWDGKTSERIREIIKDLLG